MDEITVCYVAMCMVIGINELEKMSLTSSTKRPRWLHVLSCNTYYHDYYSMASTWVCSIGCYYRMRRDCWSHARPQFACMSVMCASKGICCALCDDYMWNELSVVRSPVHPTRRRLQTSAKSSVAAVNPVFATAPFDIDAGSAYIYIYTLNSSVFTAGNHVLHTLTRSHGPYSIQILHAAKSTTLLRYTHAHTKAIRKW